MLKFANINIFLSADNHVVEQRNPSVGPQRLKALVPTCWMFACKQALDDRSFFTPFSKTFPSSKMVPQEITTAATFFSGGKSLCRTQSRKGEKNWKETAGWCFLHSESVAVQIQGNAAAERNYSPDGLGPWQHFTARIMRKLKGNKHINCRHT